MKHLQLKALAAMLVLATLGSCKKDSGTAATPTYTVPTTYNFSNVNYSDATIRLGMATQMGNLLGAATSGPIDGQRLLNMFSNTNAPFDTASYNTSGLQLKDQCAALLQTDMVNFIDSMVVVSNSNQAASRGVAGLAVSSANPSKLYALSALGVNYAQVFKKSIMGGLIISQIVGDYMQAGIASTVNNTTVVPGQGTAMEHNWDLAFGYWDVPINFPSNKTGASYYGSYSTQVDSGFHANAILMGAYLKGRAAISNNDMTTVQAQATLIMQTYESLTGAAALQEINEIKAAANDPAARISALSECWGFVHSLKYNPARKISDAQIDAILALFPANFYDLTNTDINNIQTAVATQYNFTAVVNIL